jgi:DNA-directed RNA polymerase beta' subunit
MKNIEELFSSYIASYANKQNEPVETYLELWQCLSIISQINSSRHSTKNKTDKDKLNNLFKDYAKDILEALQDAEIISKIKNVLSFTNSECPILVTKFEDLGEYINNIKIKELFDLQAELLKLKAELKINSNFLGNVNEENTGGAESYKRIKQIEKKLDYFLESLVSLLHLGKNKMFKSIKLDLLGDNASDYASDNNALNSHASDNSDIADNKLYKLNKSNLDGSNIIHKTEISFAKKIKDEYAAESNNNFSDFDIEFSDNAADILYCIILSILKL